MHRDQARFQTECPYRVCELSFDAKGRCTACGHEVVDLSAGTEEEAERFFRNGAKKCMAYLSDRAGNIVFGRPALTATLAAAAVAAITVADRLQPAPAAGTLPSDDDDEQADRIPEVVATVDPNPTPPDITPPTPPEDPGLIPEVHYEIDVLPPPPPPITEPMFHVTAGIPVRMREDHG